MKKNIFWIFEEINSPASEFKLDLFSTINSDCFLNFHPLVSNITGCAIKVYPQVSNGDTQCLPLETWRGGFRKQSNLIQNIPILPSGILDFCKQKLWPLLSSQQIIWHMLAIHMSHPFGNCATPWPSYGNRAWCNPMSHPCGYCTTPWPSCEKRAWCNLMSHRAWCNPVSHAWG